MNRRDFSRAAAGVLLANHTAELAPAAAGPSPRDLSAFRRRARELGVRGLVVLQAGRTILSDGDVSAPMRIASIRKSIISALYGMAVAEGRVDLDASIGSLGIEDYTPLTKIEKQATVRHLLMARSGIYLPTAAETEAMKSARPPRGSHAPGQFWYYNNWDFNALGEIYERVTGESLFTAIEHRLAHPLAWQDFRPLQHMQWYYDPAWPRFPAYNIFMSARDLARFGQLYLQRGHWDGRRLIPADWVALSTSAISATGPTDPHGGYGYLWWVTTERDRTALGLPMGTYTAAGNGGRYVSVVPGLNLVLAVQPDEVSGQPPVRLYAEKLYPALLGMLVRALV